MNLSQNTNRLARPRPKPVAAARIDASATRESIRWLVLLTRRLPWSVANLTHSLAESG
jgi:hypothetical protein